MDSNQKEEGSSTEAETKKCCSVCKTTKTPLWRSGPSGPKSLCNACGIRYRKKRPNSPSPTKTLHMKKGKMGKKRRSMKLSDGFRVNLMMMPLEEQVEEQQRVSRQWGEVERAALLLMALSCGAVFA